jgi:hypothetical protein
MALPLADVMLESVEILDVNRVAAGRPGESNDGAAGDDLSGPVTSIVVRVPRAYQTLLAFGASTSQLRYAIVSPSAITADVAGRVPAPAMSWGKYAELIAWKERQARARGDALTTTLFPRYRPLPEPGQAVIAPIPMPTPKIAPDVNDPPAYAPAPRGRP